MFLLDENKQHKPDCMVALANLCHRLDCDNYMEGSGRAAIK